MNARALVRRVNASAAVLIAATVAIGAGACSRDRPPAAPADPVGADAPATIRAEGRVATAPGATVPVAAEADGRVVAVRVVEGDRVVQGEVLAGLDSAEERAALDEARARLAEGEAQLGFLSRHYDRVDSLVRGGHLAIEELDAVTRDRAVARARVQEAGATVARLAAVLAKRTVRSPLTGRVVARSVEPGQMVVPGAPLFTVADLSRRQVEAEVDESDIAHLQIGAPATISAEGYGGRTWAGRVASIPDQVVVRRLRPEDPTRPSDTRVLLVKVDIPAAAPFKLGQRVELQLRVLRPRALGAEGGD